MAKPLREMANVIKPKGKKKKRENSRMFSLSLYFPQPEKKINVSPIKIIVEAISGIVIIRAFEVA